MGLSNIPLTACTTIPADSRKKKDTPTGVFLFGAALLLRKSGRLRAGDLTYKGNPTKVSLAYIPVLAYTGVRTGSKTCGQSQKQEAPHLRRFLLF